MSAVRLMSWLVVVIGAIGLAELCLALLVRRLRPTFQWLVAPGDESPTIVQSDVERHLERGFDSELGWVRRPNTVGIDTLHDGTVEFHIDERGARRNPCFEGKPSLVAAFGDSFTFCRLVEDDETWPHFLSKRLGTNVHNFGVGNYGLDQALLRLERELPTLDGRIIVMGIVPETMARIHSYWKHYFEYGNLLAFKPRFTEQDGELIHHGPAVRTPEEFANYQHELDRIRELDSFYRTKFRQDCLYFPYLWRLIRTFRRNGPILVHLVAGLLTGDRAGRRRRAFQVVVRENAAVTASLYRDAESRSLFRALIRRFAAVCRAADRVPVLAVIPQPVDLARLDRGYDDYRPFFESLRDTIELVDLTDLFLSRPSRSQLYREGLLGPHTSALANDAIAARLEAVLRPVLESQDQRCRGETAS
jgi:hypothetical protein